MFQDFLKRREEDKKAPVTDGAAAYRLRATASFREVADAMIERQAMKDRLKAFFDSGYDAILMPPGTITAFPHNQEGSSATRRIDVDGAQAPYLSILNWIALGSALHVPALAVQAGFTQAGIPVGVQLVSRWNNEDLLFDVGAEVEKRLGGFVPPKI
jgi:Asp-tRNA(Asn)/Glu-tRNA(Gln) amidotransferase A subunit family amidase